jgi:hypothetical protein
MRLKNRVFEILSGNNFLEKLPELRAFPGKKVVNHLFSFLYSIDEIVKWRAVTAMGETVSLIAKEDIESARVVMRRLMWNLNDESGGIGWGSPEAMGEIMSRDARLGGEYNRILISYININGNYLENEDLRRGVLWGLWRIASSTPGLVKDSVEFLIPCLVSGDATLRGLAAIALGAIDPAEARRLLPPLKKDEAEIRIYSGGAMNNFKIKNIVDGIFLIPERMP